MTIRGRVLDALKRFPETRNDDRLLYWKVLEEMGLAILHHPVGYVIKRDDIEKMPSFESIQRRRQEFNEQGKFIPTDPEVLALRRIYYNLCPRELLDEEGQPEEVVMAVCRRCHKRHTEGCHLIGGVPAGI